MGLSPSTVFGLMELSRPKLSATAIILYLESNALKVLVLGGLGRPGGQRVHIRRQRREARRSKEPSQRKVRCTG